jgi:uncharacterized membrane protein (DUF2068 family)
LSTTGRPSAVKILVLLHILLPVLTLVRTVLPGRLTTLRAYAPTPLANWVVTIVFVTIDLVLAYGLWKGKKWAWVSALVWSLLGMASSIFDLFLRPLAGEFILLIIELVIVYLLMQPVVQRYCGKGSTRS